MESTVKLKPLFNEIASAIHEKDGLSDGIAAYNFPERIRAIQRGSIALDELVIVSEPTKLDYTTGEVFDQDGLVVKAVYTNGATKNVVDYTILPDGPLTENDTIISIQYTEDGVTKTAEVNITVDTAHIYGVEWDGSSTTKWTRTDESVDFTDPVPAVNNGDGSSPFDDIQPWAGMVKDTSDSAAGVLVKIPKFWYKWTKSGNTLKLQIADGQTDGFNVSPAHADRGDGKGERDFVYVGRYHCATSTYKSTTGVKPVTDITRSTARTNIHNLGATIWQFDYAMRVTIQMLYLVEYADWNSQAKIGYGCGNNSAKENMGATDGMTYHTGTKKSSRTTYGVGVQYRWIEGLWDNVYDWMDGCYYNSSGMNIIMNPNNFSESANGTLIGKPSSGYPSAIAVATASGLEWAIYPTAASGSVSTYVADDWGYGASSPCLFCGGSFEQSQSRGFFCVYSFSTSGSGAVVGCRLQKLP